MWYCAIIDATTDFQLRQECREGSLRKRKVLLLKDLIGKLLDVCDDLLIHG